MRFDDIVAIVDPSVSTYGSVSRINNFNATCEA
jgi:hypothetical protein